MSRLKRNIVANYLGRGMPAIFLYLFVPFYLRLLGREAYGVVSFYTVLQAVFAFSNLGLANTLTRELARLSVAENSAKEMRDLLRTVEMIFWGTAITVALLVASGSPLIAEHWLNADSIAPNELRTAILLMGVSLAFLFPFNVYTGALLGLQQQVSANAVLITTNFVRDGGTVLVLYFFSPTLQTFFLCQVAGNALRALVVATVLWRGLPAHADRPHFSKPLLESIWKYAAGMLTLTLLSIALSQIDKLSVSKMLTLTEFAVYGVASQLSQAPLIFAGPISTAIFPRLTQLAEVNNEKDLTMQYHQACQLLSLLTFPVCAVLIGFSREILVLWTRDSVVASDGALPAALLLLGTTFQAAQMMPYYLALAYGWVRLSVVTATVSVAIILPLLPLLVSQFGTTGAALGWVLVHAGIAPIYARVLHRRHLRAEYWRWALGDVLKPAAAAAMAVGAFRYFVPSTSNRLGMIVSMGGAFLATLLVTLFAAPLMRDRVMDRFRKRVSE